MSKHNSRYTKLNKELSIKRIRKNIAEYKQFLKDLPAWRRSRFEAEVRQLEAQLHKINIPVTQPKLDRLFSRFKRRTTAYLKPILVMYFSPEAQNELQANNFGLIRSIQQKIGDKYYALILPCVDTEQARAEVWYRGKTTSHYHQRLFEGSIFAFNYMSR
jgi:hypothetical protein